jgi:hypothetical protein
LVDMEVDVRVIVAIVVAWDIYLPH